MYERVYHKSLQRNWNQSFSGTQIVENPELLIAIDEITDQNNSNHSKPNDTDNISNKDVSFESPKLNQSVLVPANKQVEVRLPSGKRRITPMLLTSVQSNNVDSAPDKNK